MSDDMREGKLDGHSFRTDQQLDVSIMEAKLKEKCGEDDSELGWKDKYKSWKDDPEKIGKLITDSMFVVLYLQPDAFDLFWTAAEATHGSTRNMEFVLKPDSPDTLTVTNIRLILPSRA